MNEPSPEQELKPCPSQFEIDASKAAIFKYDDLIKILITPDGQGRGLKEACLKELLNRRTPPQDKPCPHEDAEIHKLKGIQHHMEACRSLLDLDDDVTVYDAIKSMMVMVNDFVSRGLEIQHLKEREAKLVEVGSIMRDIASSHAMQTYSRSAAQQVDKWDELIKSLNLDEKKGKV